MTDRELLGLAAKAYADPNVNFDGFSLVRFIGRDENLGCNVMAQWNPLYDDGDALRMAVCLDINVHTKGDCVFLGDIIVAYNPDDIYSATRRAIVRAAAEIGKEM